MLIQRYSLQPDVGSPYVSLLSQALQLGSFLQLDVAMAYASVSGVIEIRKLFEDYDALNLRWLLGIDWCRSDPQALESLYKSRNSDVRIHDGAYVVGRPGCTPRRSFHPKTWILRGGRDIGVIIGSGNLSLNGLTKGYEHGILQIARTPRRHWESEIRRDLRSAASWFELAWRKGTPYRSVRHQYERKHRSARITPAPIEDDTTNDTIEPRRVQQIRAASELWIEAGTLSKNLGRDVPGNQLDMSRMTRVFFGFPATKVERNTILGPVAIRLGSNDFDENMRFGNNYMDKLNLPVPGAGGPITYDGCTLRFQREIKGDGSITFELRVRPGGPGSWATRSNNAGTAYTMQSGRRWGVS